ncbi:tRNA (adenosine(37)-N6)-threonylcarbamoyltransferase complex ATPase subunit type 1 TsaE [Polynucleobacter sp. IMCC 30228]|nr:tRNA (adenosine(37)-N6)-threonylcarbamoyltransferase complex ATPase subunit type 1 TsaE [Polynucleobacter sp. IMCC 30228]
MRKRSKPKRVACSRNQAIFISKYTLNQLSKHCRQESETGDLARSLGQALAQYFKESPDGQVNLALSGELGAGKTSFARSLIQSMGHLGKVKSPSYALCEPYSIAVAQHSIAVHHFDLFRMRSPLEWQEAGFADLFATPGLCLVEWPEKAEDTLPVFDLSISITALPIECEREIHIAAHSPTGQIIFLKLESLS